MTLNSAVPTFVSPLCAIESSIRIIADGIAPKERVDFYIESQLVGTYTTSSDGQILETARIPENLRADRTNFILLDSQNNRKDLSIRLGSVKAETSQYTIKGITISGPVDVKTSEIAEFQGTALQNSHIVVTVSRPDLLVLESKIIEASVSGKWTHNVLVPSDMPEGAYTIQATNGYATESRLFTVDDARIIDIAPTLTQFEPGNVMTFTGTVQPGYVVGAMITDPIDNEVYSETIEPDLDGNILIEFVTTHFDQEGTYTLHITQNSNTAVIFGGLGEPATEGIEIHIDKINYRSSESINAIIEGSPKSAITIIVLDSADRKKLNDPKVIGSSGRLNYLLDLSEYPTGVYTLIVTKGGIEKEAIFGVNIGYGTGIIDIKTTKSEYVRGSDILVLGKIDTNTPVLMDLSLLDPNGVVIKTKQVFSGGSSTNDRISDNTFRVPTDAIFGTWALKAQSGDTNVGTAEFKVIEVMESGAQISVEKQIIGIEPKLVISGSDIPNLSKIHIKITTLDEKIVFDDFEWPVESGKFMDIWDQNLDYLNPGTYLVVTELSETGIQFTVP